MTIIIIIIMIIIIIIIIIMIIIIIIIIARAKRGLTIRKQPSFVPGPRIFYCYALLFSAGQ